MSAGQDRFRSRLDALAEPVALHAVLDDWSNERGAPARAPWRQDYGRFYPDRDPWAVLVFEAGPLLLRADVHEGVVSGAVEVDGIGHVRLSEPTEDPALPGLGEVLAGLTQARIVRYRPGKRCTATGTAAAGPRFVKVVPDPSTLHRDAVELWQASGREELGFHVAQPHGMDARTGALWQGVVPGDPVVDELSGPGGGELARQMGVALASLARSAAQPLAVAGTDVQLARTERAARRVQDRIPHLAPQLGTVLEALHAMHDRLSPQPLVPVHGAPHVHQWLADVGQLGLIDFDRFARGEPELDVATFLAEVDGDSSLSLPVAALEEGLVQGYRDGGTELDPQRLALYRSHKRLAKVTRAAWSLRPDGDSRAERHLRRVCEALSI